MRANLRAGKLHPKPRTINHARLRVQQLDYEIDGMQENHKKDDLRQERVLLIDWIKANTVAEAMTMTTKKTEQEPLTKQELHTVISALRVAADAYEADEKQFRQAATDIGNGKSFPMFVAGDAGVKAATRLADQFFLQAQDARKVLEKLEQGEGGDGTVGR